MTTRIRAIAFGLVRSTSLAALGPDAWVFVHHGVATERVMRVALRSMSN